MKIVVSLVVFVIQAFTDDRIFMLLNAQVEMTACVAYTIWITRITLKFIHNALLIYKCCKGFVSVTFKSSETSLLVKTGSNSRLIFFPRSLSCLCMKSVDFWSLKGKVISKGLLNGLIRFWVWSWEVWNLLKVESISGHLQLWIEEHKYPVIGKHLKDKQNQRSNNLHKQFTNCTTLKKCHGKFECLIYEML